MRLLNTETIELEEFPDDRIPQYVILSHRWEEEEVSFRDMEFGAARRRKGYGKIKACCQRAASKGLMYVWVDTCCIDKSSSAELSEAINSMYKWYKQAAVCFAYLSDASVKQDLASSIWFTRSWTLQELIAPDHLEFLNRFWFCIGTKKELADELQTITGISRLIITGFGNLSTVSLADRMSWAAGRSPTRPEDRAYSLLGLFDVNMPLLYGEGGEKAFIRLQEEIIKRSYDHTIFSWSDPTAKYHGLFAPSPSCFSSSRGAKIRAKGQLPEESWVTNVGLSIKMHLIPWDMCVCLAILNCHVASEKGQIRDNKVMALYLRSLGNGRFIRVAIDGKDREELGISYNDFKIWDTENQEYEQFGAAFREKGVDYIPHRCPGFRRIIVCNDMTVEKYRNSSIYAFHIGAETALGSDPHKSRKINIFTRSEWNAREKLMWVSRGQQAVAGIVVWPSLDNKLVIIKLGFDTDFDAVCEVCSHETISHSDELKELVDAKANGQAPPHGFPSDPFSMDWISEPGIERGKELVDDSRTAGVRRFRFNHEDPPRILRFESFTIQFYLMPLPSDLNKLVWHVTISDIPFPSSSSASENPVDGNGSSNDQAVERAFYPLLTQRTWVWKCFDYHKGVVSEGPDEEDDEERKSRLTIQKMRRLSHLSSMSRLKRQRQR